MRNQLFALWTGENQLTPNRKSALEAMQKITDVEVVLITPKTLPLWIVPNYPLHDGYEYLSAVHKSDYLRCYLMHHYGGGYSDIKTPRKSWEKAFNQLRASDKLALGYKEVGKHGVAQVEDQQLQKQLNQNWHRLIGCCAFICKPQTAFTQLWYDALHNKMDSVYELLKQNKGNIWGNNEGYPLKWTEIMGNIFHPVVLQFKDQIIKNDDIKPNFQIEYR